MSDWLSHPSGRCGGLPSLPGALGVLWSPANPRQRLLVPRLLLPGQRRNGGARRRRSKGQHAACHRSTAAGGLVLGGTACGTELSALRIAGLATAS
jgi:hypothetical protein